MMPEHLTLTWYRGDTPGEITVTFTEDGVPVDVSDSTFAAQIRARRLDDDPPIVEVDVDTTDAADGIVVVRPTADDSETVWDDGAEQTATTRAAELDLEWTDPAGRVLTIFDATITTRKDVTR